MPNLAFPNAATPVGSIPYYAIRFSPAEQRNGLAARYSWLHEIDRIISTIKDPGVARLKLDWWHKEWTQALSGSATHPVTIACEKALPRNATNMIDGIIKFSEKAILGFNALNDQDWLAEMRQRAYLQFAFLSSDELTENSIDFAMRSQLIYWLFSLPEQLSIGRMPFPQSHSKDTKEVLGSIKHLNFWLNTPLWHTLTEPLEHQHEHKLIDRFLKQQEVDLKRLRKVGFSSSRTVAYPVIRLIRSWQARDI